MSKARAVIVTEGVVANVIIVDTDDPSFELEGSEVVIIPNDSPVTFGWGYLDVEFIAPEEPVEE